jgi:hypothetical protein
LKFHQFGKNGGRAVEQGSGKHGAIDPLALRVVLLLISGARLGQANARDVDTMFYMIEKPPGQRLDQGLFRLQCLRRRLIEFDPVAVVKDASLAVDLGDRAIFDFMRHVRRVGAQRIRRKGEGGAVASDIIVDRWCRRMQAARIDLRQANRHPGRGIELGLILALP